MALGGDPQWYKDAVIYELHVKSFFDSADDGVGDFRGLMQKLGYLEDLGITTIWLLPFYPSPLRDDGYDIADYYNLNRDFGSLRDFREFLSQAHERGIRVIIELVVNHTSDQHPWFQRARLAKPGSAWRDYYVWSDTPDKYLEARIIFKDFETSNWTWDPVAKAYYWHRFYSHQPDLNYDNPRVQKEIFRVLDYWFDMGVDGLRLDAIPYLYEREGTNCENLPETHVFLKRLRAHVDKHHQDKLLLAEANQWPEDAAAYFGDGDECHMAFHFPVMPRLFMAFKMEDRFPIVDILEQTPKIPDNCQWAMFLRNHDELTLEMVTDEERDYMYRVFAQDPRARINLGIRRRLAPLMNNNYKKIELMNILLFSLPGTPVIYYGDEIGMGDNYYLGDRNGVRTPMQWSSDRNAGFSRANPQQLFLPIIIDPEYHYEALNVENQERNVSSFLWWMKRVIAMRKRFQAFSRGSLEFLFPENGKVLAFVRRYQDEVILVVINLSRFSQFVELHMPEFAGYVPEEVFSQSKFPAIHDKPYFLSLGPHGHFWFQLEKAKEPKQIDAVITDGLKVLRHWTNIFEHDLRRRLEKEVLPVFLMKQRWFGAKTRSIRRANIIERISLPGDEHAVLILQVDYTVGPSDQYILPVSFAYRDQADAITNPHPGSVIVSVYIGEKEGQLFDAIYDPGFHQILLQIIAKRKKIKGIAGELFGAHNQQFRRNYSNEVPRSSRFFKADQSNSSILYEDKFFLKVYRRIEQGINPEPEMNQFLSENKFGNVPLYSGSIEYKTTRQQSPVLALLQEFIQNEGDAWQLALTALGQYFDRILEKGKYEFALKSPSMLNIQMEKMPPEIVDLIGGGLLGQVSLLGKRTGEMHLVLASPTSNPDFVPEAFTKLYQRSLFQSLRSKATRTLQLLEARVQQLPANLQDDAREILNSRATILGQLRALMDYKISALKIRVHGDYHLGQVLFTGKDFVIIDFEGEPARAPSERRLKYSCFRDVAGMIRSFHYAAYSALFQKTTVRTEDVKYLEQFIQPWYRHVSGTFLRAYLDTVASAPFVPAEAEELAILLQVFLLDKAIYELGYELNNRPDWLIIPVQGIKMVINQPL